MKRVALHARADAAGEAALHVRVFAPYARADGNHVTGRAVVAVDRAENMVEQRALVEFGVANIRLPREQLSRELQHVVDVARLRGAALGDVAQQVGLAEVLVLAVATRRERVVIDDAIPERGGGGLVGTIAGVGIARGRADGLGHLRVAVQAAERILPALQRVHDGLVLELVGEVEPTPVAGVGVQVGHHLVHAAELGGEHLLNGRVIHRIEIRRGPSRELDLDLERRLVAGVAIRVAQARERLVQRVPRRPQAVEIEVRRADVAVRHLRERRLHALQRPGKPVAMRVLHQLQLAHDVVGALLEANIAGGGEHQADGREVMPGNVSCQLAAIGIPTCVALGFWPEPRKRAVKRQHAVGLE